MATFQPSRKEVAEVFGYPAHSTLPAAALARSQHLCPFRGDEGSPRKCSKLSQHRLFDQFGQTDMPFGACSVWYRGRGEKQFRPAIICPIRFTQNQRVFRKARQILKDWTAQSRFLVLQEVGLPLGRLDYILANFKPDTNRVLDFCVLETMALSTTTTGHIIRSMFEVLGMAPSLPVYKYGLNLRQVVSRMIVQMVAKAYAAEQWEKRTVWVMQDILYDYLVRTTRLNLADVAPDDVAESRYPLLFFVYELVMQDWEQMFTLRLQAIKGGDRRQVEAVLQPNKVPSLAEVQSTLEQHIEDGQYIELQ